MSFEGDSQIKEFYLNIRVHLLVIITLVQYLKLPYKEINGSFHVILFAFSLAAYTPISFIVHPYVVTARSACLPATK